MSVFPPKLNAFLEDFSFLGDRDQRSDYLIEISSRFREVPADVAVRPFDEAHKVPACESQAYAWALPKPDGTLKFYFAVENPQGISAKALAVILDESLSGENASTIATVPEDLVYQIFGREITMGRGQGLMSMVSMLKALAKKSLGST